jgi:hypothetical protein
MEFSPIYLYIKQHSITGKLYFGKTIQDPDNYLGSGKVWSRHIKLHGIEHVETLWYCLFLDKESIKEFSLSFSKIQNIVESKEWLNLKPENGTDGGGCPGRICSFETRAKTSAALIGHQVSKITRDRISVKVSGNKKISEAMKNRVISEQTKAKMSASKLGIKQSIETCNKRSASHLGKKQTIVVCPHCLKEGGSQTMPRWHFNNCKSKNETT